MRASIASALVVAVLVAMAVSLSLGAVALSPGDVWRGLMGTGDATAVAIVRDLRLPRTALGVLVGAALGASGTALQSTLRNPLAEPYLLGVSGGAAVGAVLATAAGLTAIGVISAFAFGGALVAVGLVLLLARQRPGNQDPRTLLMAGVVIGAFANAVIMVALAQASATEQRGALWWMMGSIATARWADVAWLGGAVAVLGGAIVHRARDLDVVALGPETASSLGVQAERTGSRFFLLASLLAAATVATAGLIGFVGLIVPHLARGLPQRASARATTLAAAALGAVLVLGADVVARLARAPAELPLGAITALLGVPFFLRQLRVMR
jgi:iron complex transport system permease protein